MTKAKDLRELTDEELTHNLTDAKKELFNLRFQLATGRLDNVTRIPTLRREIARLLTIAGERERALVAVAKEES